MQQVWLRPNRRVLAMAMVLPAIVMVIASYLAATSVSASGVQIAWLIVGVVGLVLIGLLARHWRQPRMARCDDYLLLYLKSGEPYRLPLEVVECFFLGATDANVPGNGDSGGKISALVVRLAERAEEWRERPVKPSLGKWDDGYVRIYGAWCERLCMGKLGRLNTKLQEAQRELRQTTAASAEGEATSE